MAMTEAQWNAMQASFPAEDRMSYADYIQAIGGTLEQFKTAEGTTPTTIADERGKIAGAAADTAAQKNPTTLTPAQKQAALARFTAGQSLTEAEKAYLGLQTEASKAAQLAAEDAAALAEKNAAAAALAEKLRLAKEAEEAAKAAALAAANAKTAEEKAAAEAAAAAAREAAAAAAADADATGILAGENSSNTQAALDAADKIVPLGTAWVKSPDGKSWIKPTMPTQEGFGFSWDDDKGWISFKVGNEPPPRPEGVNKFYIYDTATKTWIQPPKPQDGAIYTWDDNVGWVQETPGAKRPPGTPAAYIYNEKTKTWVKPPQTNPTDTWDDNKGWVPKPATSKTVISEKYIGSGATRKKVITYSDNTSETVDAPEIVNGDGGAGTGSSGTGGSGTGGTLTQADVVKAVADALAKSAATTAQNNMIQILTDRFSKYGLTGLASKIKELAINGATESTITLALQDTDEYKTRFAANADRIKKGLSVLTPAEYLNIEDSYRQVLRAYGLKQFDNDAYVKQFIANDVSPTELSNRVVTAVQRVQNADPAITKQLKGYYGIGVEDMVGYVLDPEQSFQKIERQVAASEIGVAAGRQGLQAGVSVAEQLAAQGVTQAEAQKGYATIADILPTAEKLSSIYGDTMEGYGQAEGEQEVFNSLASAQRKRQKLTAREIAQFGGSSGLSRTALTDQAKGNF